MTEIIRESVERQAAALGQRIRAEREHQKLSLREVARRAGIGLQTLIRLEAGNPAVNQSNYLSVMQVLGLSGTTEVPRGLSGGPRTQPLHPLHINSEEVAECIEAAASAACRELDQLFAGLPPETQGINSNFQGLLVEHLRAMLTGIGAATRNTNPRLNVLVYSNATVGGPLSVETSENLGGWVLRLEGTSKAWQDGREMSLNTDLLDPYVSRSVALERFRIELELHGAPPGPVSAVPVYWLPNERLGWTPARDGHG